MLIIAHTKFHATIVYNRLKHYPTTSYILNPAY